LHLLRKQYNRTGEVTTTVKSPEPGMEYVQLILKYDPDIEPHVPVKEPWVHRGQSGRTADGKEAVRLTYRFAHPVIDDWMLEPLSHDMAGVVRHELEHGAQGDATHATSPGGDWGNVEKVRAYLLHPREVEAFTTQVYLQSKREGVPITVLIGRKTDRLEKAMRRRDVDIQVVRSVVNEYRKAVTEYAAKRYPTAKFQTSSGKTVLARDLRGPWW